MTGRREEKEKEADRTSKGVKEIRFLLTELRTSAASLKTLEYRTQEYRHPSSLSVLPNTGRRASSVIRVLLGKQPGVCGQSSVGALSVQEWRN